MASCIRKLVDSLATIAAFKARYGIIDQISLELVDLDDFCIEETKKGMPFQVIAIIEGGFRFSLHHFLYKCIIRFKVAPSQLSSNFYRIINEMLEINQCISVNLGHVDLEYSYTLCKAGGDSYNAYLQAIDKSREIVKGVDAIRVWVFSPLVFGNLPSVETPLGWCHGVLQEIDLTTKKISTNM